MIKIRLQASMGVLSTYRIPVRIFGRNVSKLLTKNACDIFED